MTRHISFNAFTNVLQTVLAAASGLATMPILVARFGDETYGLWTLVVATTGYFAALDLGVPAAAGRLFAGNRDHINSVNGIFFTAFGLLCGIFLTVCLLTVIASFVFFGTFPVPLSQQADVRCALLIMGGGVALSIPLALFESFLWGLERFDLHNVVEIAVVLVRLLLIVFLIESDSTLIELALIVTGTAIGGGLIRAGLCWMLEPRIVLHWRNFSIKVLKEVSAFSRWFAVLSAFRALSQNIPIFVIGNTLGAVAVTTFTIPRLLIMYGGLIVASAMGAIAPRVAILHFAKRSGEQRELFLLAGYYCLALSYYFAGGFVFFGLSFLQIWQPTQQAHEEYALLLILVAGELLPMSQRSAHAAILNMGKHRRLALYGAAELVVIAVLAFVLAQPYGLTGVCVAAAISNLFFRGILELSYGCRLVGVKLPSYIGAVFLPVSGAALLSFTLFWLVGLSQVNSWLELLSAGGIYTLIYWTVLGPWLLSHFKRPSPA